MSNNNNNNNELPSNLPTTVLGTLRYAERVYREISDSSPLESDYQKKVGLGVTLFLRLWSHIANEGTFRRGESLREMSDTNLELISVPFFLGVLCERKQANQPAASSPEQQQQQQQDPHRGPADEVTQRITRSNARIQSLAACNDFLFKFLKVCVDVKLCSEKDVETKPFAASMDRTTRLEITKRRYELEDEWKQLDSQVRFARERARRNAKVIRADEEAERRKAMNQDDDDDNDDKEQRERENEGGNASDLVAPPTLSEQISDEVVESLLEDDDDYQSIKRQSLVRFTQYCIYESYSLLQGNARELDVLGALSDDEKRRAVEDFQRGLMSGGAGGSSSSSASSALFNRLQQQPGAAGEKLHDPDKNYTVLPGGNVVPFGSTTHVSAHRRQEIIDEAFINRNNPTQTLEEFAQMEMAYMRKMQAQEARGKAEHEAENEMLGEEGMHERDRVKDSAMADWKDDNPPIGLSTKGNYA